MLFMGFDFMTILWAHGSHKNILKELAYKSNSVINKRLSFS